jgi:hypothetical protein
MDQLMAVFVDPRSQCPERKLEGLEAYRVTKKLKKYIQPFGARMPKLYFKSQTPGKPWESDMC